MNPYVTFEKQASGRLKVMLTDVGQHKLVDMMTQHGSAADLRELDEKGYSTEETTPAAIEDVWNDFFMFFLLLSPSIEDNEFTWGDAGERAMHGSFLLWEGVRDLAHDNLEDVPV